ncbi:MAG: HU family DNA-binding protein [Bacilli bacterium]|jgi:nucleoid DNA-binding protein|nr:HU family DNA-binding protein [Bacilli bacterium]
MKKDIYLQAIKDKTGFAKKDIDLIIDTYFELLKEQLNESQTASITNFGTFHIKTTKPYTYFSPVDGSTLSTKGIQKIYFTSSKALLKHITR